jgi:hypothetical protein
MQSLELSRAHGSRARELRTATDLAELLKARGQSDRARELLQLVFEQFVDGAETADLKAAERLLANLKHETRWRPSAKKAQLTMMLAASAGLTGKPVLSCPML